MPPWLRRFNIYGDFWRRYLALGVRFCPWFLEPVIIPAFTAFFYLLCGGQRRAVQGNLRALFPADDAWAIHRRAFAVFLNFAWVLTDSAHQRSGDDVIDWEVAGQERLAELGKLPGAAMIFTAHMGSYDLAAPLFVEKLRRRLHTVRAPERVAETQEYATQDRPTGNAIDDQFVVHYNTPGSMLAVELTKVLQAGEVLAVQGDRVMFDVSPMPVPFSKDYNWRLPKGPCVLAAVARCPIYPLFVIRVGWRRYRIEARPEFRWETASPNRRDSQRELEEWWSQCLREVIETHWNQWFVFEPAFEKRNAPEGGPPAT
ncbi:MAG: hypothetical protein KDK97_03160 [Verrucomicrobiales bacterium]|nr:hypothetical protein [Verrucomicrobiales bacterium]MCP5560595.1 hypothetical protein [Verrucomicrobiaceae bacterium]